MDGYELVYRWKNLFYVKPPHSFVEIILIFIFKRRKKRIQKFFAFIVFIFLVFLWRISLNILSIEKCSSIKEFEENSFFATVNSFKLFFLFAMKKITTNFTEFLLKKLFFFFLLLLVASSESSLWFRRSSTGALFGSIIILYSNIFLTVHLNLPP